MAFDWNKLEIAPTNNKFDWNDHPLADTQPVIPPTKTESLARGAAQGATAGFSDELSGGGGVLGYLLGKLTSGPSVESTHPEVQKQIDAIKSHYEKNMGDIYRETRDEERTKNETAQKTNPWSYGVGQVVGGIAPAVGLGAVMPAAGLVGGAETGAAFGALQGLGDSQADITKGYVGGAVSDTLRGAAIGGVMGGALEAAAPVITSGARKVMPWMAGKLSGVDVDAATRQFERPVQSAAAEADGFGNEVAKTAQAEMDAKSAEVGKAVGTAGENFNKDFGDATFPQAQQELPAKIDDFLEQNKLSSKGFSTLTPSQTQELQSLSENLKTGDVTGEDLFKLRQYIDNQKNIAGKYDKEGISPFVNFLKGLRHDADAIVDQADTRLNDANNAYGAFKDDQKLLRGINNDNTAEGFINNLYSGDNKTAKQEAAERMFSPNTLEQAKDIGANKAFGQASGPAGSIHGLKNMLAFGVAGAGMATGNPVLGFLAAATTQPAVWKAGLRTMGRFAPILESAAQRGEAALAATHFILNQTDPEYRKKMADLQNQSESK